MSYYEKIQKKTGFSDAKLAELGITGTAQEYHMVLVGGFITNMVKHPTTFPKPLTLFAGMVLCGVSPKRLKSMHRKREKMTMGDRKMGISYLTCPPEFQKNDGKKRLIIQSHGFQSSAPFNLRYYRSYMTRGYDLVWFDQRGHGDGSKLGCTMGHNEAQDLINICKYYRDLLGPDATIGIHGESMGSGILANASDEVAKYVDFAVLDCGYSGMDQMACWAENLFFFWPKEKLHDLVNEMSYIDGAKWTDSNGIPHIENTPAEFPMLFQHGSIDFFVATHFSKDMYAAKQGKKDINIYPMAFHGMSQLLYPGKYVKDVTKFLDENGID